MTEEQLEIINNGRPFLLTREIVTISGKHRNTIYDWIEQEKIIPVDKVSNSYMFNKETVLEFLRDKGLL